METAPDEAIRLHKFGNRAETEPLYRALLEREPANRGALRVLAMLLVRTRRPLHSRPRTRSTTVSAHSRERKLALASTGS
ncbi:hypothetical protein FHW79_001948 [Azospirillum sp. OGB3]|nr:hypothetical protein [Azospirillum sp. OGB3]